MNTKIFITILGMTGLWCGLARAEAEQKYEAGSALLQEISEAAKATTDAVAGAGTEVAAEVKDVVGDIKDSLVVNEAESSVSETKEEVKKNVDATEVAEQPEEVVIEATEDVVEQSVEVSAEDAEDVIEQPVEVKDVTETENSEPEVVAAVQIVEDNEGRNDYPQSLNLTDEQKQQVEIIRNEYKAKKQQLLQDIKSLKKRALELNANSEADFEAILTDEQKAIFQQMKNGNLQETSEVVVMATEGADGDNTTAAEGQ